MSVEDNQKVTAETLAVDTEQGESSSDTTGFILSSPLVCQILFRTAD